ncbi:hypothetical protein BS78_02G007400 [Paspalum vaginatum]|nr:hypothetical protein BS78_02G007400 [Paspalum vaginatum]
MVLSTPVDDHNRLTIKISEAYKVLSSVCCQSFEASFLFSPFLVRGKEGEFCPCSASDSVNCSAPFTLLKRAHCLIVT